MKNLIHDLMFKVLRIIFFVENETCELEGKVEKFKTLELSFLKKNMYSNIIRMICEGILSMGLSTRNVEKVIIPLV